MSKAAAEFKALQDKKEAEAEQKKITEEYERKRREERAEFARAAQAKLEGRLPGGKRTKRLPVLKLEVADGDVVSKMRHISNTVYQLEQEATVPSRNYQDWRVADERLFGEAKAAYDGIINPFLKQPRVYKLESIREKVWERSRDTTAEDEVKADEEYQKKQKLMKERRAKMDAKMKAKPPLSLGGAKAAAAKAAAEAEAPIPVIIPPSPFATKEEELETYLDPFEPPKPWFKEIWNNKLTYVNGNTKERVFERPKGHELWQEKIDKLAKLTPREDLDGYEYREDDAERRRRTKIVEDFNRLMAEEIKRREETPNDIEIIEDVLYDLVEAVHMKEERRTDLIRKRAKRAEKATWHIVSKGYRMKQLVPIENEDGELETAVTDADFNDMIISHTGHMLALMTPPGFYEKHEAERAVVRAIEEERSRLEEFERNRPFADKARIVMALARRDPKAAANRIASGIKDRALSIPRKLKSLNRRAVMQASQRMVMRGFMSMLSASKNPRAVLTYVKDKFKQIYAEMFPKEEADEEMEALLQELTEQKQAEVIDEGPQETEAQRKKRLWQASQPKPVKHADAVLVTMTFLVDPPPIYTKRPPKSWHDELVEAEAILRHQHKETKENMTHTVYSALPQIMEQINAVLASLGRDAIEIDEDYYEAEIAKIEKQKKKRQPLKPWESRRFVSPPPRKSKKPKAPAELTPEEQEKARLEQERLEAERAEQEIQDKAEEKQIIEALESAPDNDSNQEKRVQLQRELDSLRTLMEARALLRQPKPQGTEGEIVAADANVSAPDSEAISSGQTTTLIPPPPVEPVAGVDFLVDTTGPNEARPEGAENTDANPPSETAPPSPERLGKTLRIPKLGPLPPMELYVPSSLEITTKLRAIPHDVAERLKKMPGEVKDKVKKIVKELQEPRIIKDVFDTTERKIFESMLIKEIADAVFMPVENIRIEEVRRLPKNDPKIIALQQRNKERNEALHDTRKVQHAAYLAERERRKALMASDEEHFMVEALRDFVEEQAEAWGVDIEKTLGMKKTVYGTLPSRLKKQQMLALENGSLDGNDNVEEDPAARFEQEVLRLEDAERSISGVQSVAGSIPASISVPVSISPVEVGEESQIQLHPLEIEEDRAGEEEKAGENHSHASSNREMGLIGELGFDGSSVSSKALTVHTLSTTDHLILPPEAISEEEILRLGRQREERLGLYEEDLVNLMEEMVSEVYSRVYQEQAAAEEEEAFLLMSIPESKLINSPPAPPKMFKLGLQNPDIMQHDPNYWLAKAVRPATKTELRDRRLKRLHMAQRKEGLELRLQQLKDLRDELIYDAHEYYDENIEPLVEKVLKPLARRITALVRSKLREYGNFLDRAAREAKNKMLLKLQEGLMGLQPLSSGDILAIDDAPKIMSLDDMRAEYAIRWRERALKRCQELKDLEPFDPSTMPAVTTTTTADGEVRTIVVKPTRPGLDVVNCLEFLTTEVDRRVREEEQLKEQQRQADADRDKTQRVTKRFTEDVTAAGHKLLEEGFEGPAESPESLMEWAEVVSCVDSISAEAARRAFSMLSAEELLMVEGLGDERLIYFPTEVQVGSVLRECVDSVAVQLEREQHEAFAKEWEDLAEQRAAISAIFETFRKMEEEQRRLEEEQAEAIAAAQDKLGQTPGANTRLTPEEERALADEEEKNLSAELRELRDMQAKQKAEDDLRARFRRLRRQRRRQYDTDVVDLLNKMCIAIEIAAEFGDNPIDLLPEIEDDYDLDDGKAETESTPPTPRDGTSRPASAAAEGAGANLDGIGPGTADSAVPVEPEEEEELPVMGCEVSFMIHITDEERAVDGLSDLEAEDVAIMLMRQFEDPHSQLRSGYLGQRLLDYHYAIPFRKKLFETWESFWVHVIHPVFFYRTVGKSIPAREKNNGGRLESGLMMINPTHEFSERSKDTFLLYQKKYLKKARPKKGASNPEEDALAEEIRAKAAAKKAKQANVVDMNVDEFASDVKNLQVVRPNMATLTKKDVERMRRIAGAFDEEYKKEMGKGLVDGERLDNLQYQALRNRETAWRIYTSCKTKLNTELRKARAGDDDELNPVLKATVILPETFEGWMDELRLEQTNNLREMCAKRLANKELREQEMSLRRHFVKQRQWIINDKLTRMANGTEMGTALYKEIHVLQEEKDKALIGELNDNEMAKHTTKMAKIQAGVISEEKNTRTLFEVIKNWVRRKNRKLQSKRLSGMAVRKRHDTAIYTAMYLGLQGQDFSIVDALFEKSESTADAPEAMEVIYEDTESEHGSSEDEDKDDSGDEKSQHSRRSSGSNAERRKSSSPGKPGTPSKENEVAKRRKKKVEDELPFLYREELMSFIEVFCVQTLHLETIAETEKRELEEVKAEVTARKQAMAVMGQSSGMSEKEEIQAEIHRRRSVQAAVLLPSQSLSDGAGAFISASRRRVSVKEVFESGPKRRMTIGQAGNVDVCKANIARIDEGGLALLPEELELCKEIEWLRTVREDEDFYETLRHLPLQNDPKIARDELIQFATVLREIVPMLKRSAKRLQEEKEADLVAAGFRGKKDMAAASGLSNKEQKRLEREAALAEKRKNMPMSVEELTKQQAIEMEKALKSGMNAEGMLRLKKAEEALRRQAAREKAWLMAHQHRFIKYPGEAAFCIACKEKSFEIWLENFNKAETEQIATFDEDMLDNMDDYAPIAEAEYAAETAARLARTEKDLVDRYRFETYKARAEAEYDSLKKAYDKAARASKKSGGPAPIKPQKPYIKPYDYENTEMRRWRVHRLVEPHFTENKQSIPDGIWLSGLPLVDPDGESILPPPPEEEGEVAESDDEEAGGGRTQENFGLKVRVWQKDGPGLKGAFLGMVHIKEAEVLEPPNGMRTYPLRMDGYVLKRLEKEGKEPIPISGSITLMLKVTKFDHQTRVQKAAGEEKKPRSWRMEVLRASRLACADRLKGVTAYAEVFWMGPAIRDGEEEDFGGKWICVGETKEKSKQENPEWDREDHSMYELPPIWTELPIKGRGPNGTNLTGGGWVAQNMVPEPPERLTLAAQGRLSRRRLRAAMLAILAGVKILRARAECARVEISRKVDTRREIWLAEERERKCMAREERISRKAYIEEEMHRAQPLLELQLAYEREYSRLVQYIQQPPKILARLRFMMGSNSDGGGLITMCEDPATHRLLNVISVPILYPEDEEDLCSQMQRLIGKQNPNLTSIIDFSVHAARLYAQSGFPGVDQRIALAVLERYEGETFLDFIKTDWEIITNDEFRLLLAQIINGLADLHAEGIVHRNFHEKCVIVRRPWHIVAEEKAMGRSVQKPPREPNLRIGDYWFLNNPRKSGCLYSLGRADWGARSTLPPEAANGGIIDDRSDIYAFGMCVYHWATAGRILPTSFRVDDLKNDIPLRWTAWVHALLRMCLCPNPKARASAADIKRFLSSRNICKELR